ncbi:hypothetical protein [Streptomyces sp. NPDC092307]|uniref:NHL domain-containing protein n=1 Tax=Streptomyces sp. NPDC092307 TaxID=3366013 RepID=UPI003812362B
MSDVHPPFWATPPACWKYGLDSRYINTVLGNGTASTAGLAVGDGGLGRFASVTPGGLAVDAGFNVYVADKVANRVRRVDAVTGYVSTVAGGGDGSGDCATLAVLNAPSALAIDSHGTLYIAEGTVAGSTCKIRMVRGGIISTVAGGGTDTTTGEIPAITAMIGIPAALAVDSNDDLYIAEGNRIRKLTSPGTPGAKMKIIANVSGVAGSSGNGGPAVNAQLRIPSGVAVDKFGRVYIADSVSKQIRMINATGTIGLFAGGGTGSDFSGSSSALSVTLTPPRGVAVDARGNVFLMTDGYAGAGSSNGRVLMVDTAGKIATVAGVADGVGTRDALGDPVLANHSRVHMRYTSPGVPVTGIVATDPYGNVYFSEGGYSWRVRMVSGVGRALDYSLVPSSPDFCVLSRSAQNIGYVGVRLTNNETALLARQTATISLPPGKGLQFYPEGGERYLITLLGPVRHETTVAAELVDEQTLVVKDANIDLARGYSLTALFAIRALAGGPATTQTALKVNLRDSFSGFSKESNTSPIRVTA